MEGFIEKLRTTLDKAADEATKYTKIAKDKTQQLVSKAKYTASISERKNELKAVFEGIGKLVYEEYNLGAQLGEDIERECQIVDQIYDEIDAIKEKIAKLGEMTVCDECGEKNDIKNVYCSYCGAKMTDDEE